VPFGNPAKHMGNVRKMIWHIFLTNGGHASLYQLRNGRVRPARSL